MLTAPPVTSPYQFVRDSRLLPAAWGEREPDAAVDWLKRFLGPTGKILPRRRTGLSAKMQRKLTIAIKRARHMALLPFVERSITDRRR